MRKWKFFNLNLFIHLLKILYFQPTLCFLNEVIELLILIINIYHSISWADSLNYLIHIQTEHFVLLMYSITFIIYDILILLKFITRTNLFYLIVLSNNFVMLKFLIIVINFIIKVSQFLVSLFKFQHPSHTIIEIVTKCFLLIIYLFKLFIWFVYLDFIMILMK